MICSGRWRASITSSTSPAHAARRNRQWRVISDVDVADEAARCSLRWRWHPRSGPADAVMGTHVDAVALHLHVRVVFERTRLQGRHATGRAIATVALKSRPPRSLNLPTLETTAIDLLLNTGSGNGSHPAAAAGRPVPAWPVQQPAPADRRIFFDQPVLGSRDLGSSPIMVSRMHPEPAGRCWLMSSVLRHLHRLDGLTGCVLMARSMRIARCHEQDGLAPCDQQWPVRPIR